MSTYNRSVFEADNFILSNTLKRALTTLTSNAFVRFDATGADLCLTTTEIEAEAERTNMRAKLRHIGGASDIIDFSEIGLTDTDGTWARSFANTENWVVFRCSFEDGAMDLIALELCGGAHDAACKDVLAAIWRNLREDCITELQSGEG